MYLVFFSLLYRRYEGNEKTELTWLFENKHRSQSPRMKNDREIQVNFFIVVSALVSRTICWSPEFSCCALKISLGILKRPFKVFFFVVCTSSFLCCCFPWLVGLPCNELVFYRYYRELDSRFSRRLAANRAIVQPSELLDVVLYYVHVLRIFVYDVVSNVWCVDCFTG